MADQNRREYFNRRLASLKTERQSFIDHYRNLSEFIKPRMGRFFISDRNKGDKRYNNIINSVASQAHKVAVAGMRSGTIPQTRPWFALETNDPDLMEHPGVRDYLDKVVRMMSLVYSESNFYEMSSVFLGELILFGTAVMSHVDDFEDVARFYTHTAGSYFIDTNDRYETDTLVRELEWPASKIVQQFGLENCSRAVKNAVEKKNFGAWFPIVHFVEPNEDFRPSIGIAKNKAYKSVYYEPGNEGIDKDKWLSISGFEEFPAYATRWDVTGEDIYGTDCPGMTALGDVKHLQIAEKRKAQAIDKMVSPPLHGPASLRNVPINSLPGGGTFYDGIADQKLMPVYEVKPQLGDMRVDMDAIEARINRAFYVDMFLAITTAEGIQPRNQLDLIQRNEERLLQLGPVLERIQNEWLNKVNDRTFKQLLRAGVLPPPPEALSGTTLRVKYISSLVMAQRAVATQGIDRLSAYAGNLVQMGWQGVLDKFDAEQSIDEYAIAIGVPPSVIVPDDAVIEKRQADQQAAQEERVMALTSQAANAAKMASDAKTDEPNLLTELAQQ